MSWNPVLNKFIEIKNEYKRKFNRISYDYTDGYTDETKTCLERWVEELNGIEPFNQYPEYTDLLSCLELNQHNNFLLLRYGRYSNIYDGEVENSGEDLWNRYDGFYRECRSIVIDVVSDCIVLCPFRKFFNINELEETSLENIQRRIDNAKTVEFSNKLDGSMQSATWYQGEIIMAGSQAINPANSWRLQDGYRMIRELPGYEKMLREHPGVTFIFEYISLKDVHVVKYAKDQEGLYLIGIRSNATGKEYSYKAVIETAKMYNIPTTELFDKTLNVIMSELDDKSSEEAEGFVINIDGFKVKLKYNDYVHIHRALSKLSSVNLIIRSIADDKYDDLLAKLPVAYHDNVKRVAAIVVNYIERTEKQIREYYNEAPKNDKKEFMVYVSENIPKEYQKYCRELYLGSSINVIKSGNSNCPHYKKLKDMGIDNYSSIFRRKKMSRPTLWVMCGLSGSGKSTIAKQIASENQNTVIVSSDAIREELTGTIEDQSKNEEVFKIFHDRIRKNLENKKNVIADATNLTMKARRAIVMKVNGLDIYKICYVIPKPFEQCKEDNLHREHPVPNEVLEKQIRRFQIPFKEEGFNEIKIIFFDKKMDILQLLWTMSEFDQRTPWHDRTLGDHCSHVAKLFKDYGYPRKYELAARYHDVGKLYTQSLDENGIAHYYGHAEYSSYFMLEYNFFSDLSDEDILDMCFLINYHMIPFAWTTDKIKKRWRERFGEYKYQMLLDFNECDKAR